MTGNISTDRERAMGKGHHRSIPKSVHWFVWSMIVFLSAFSILGLGAVGFFGESINGSLSPSVGFAPLQLLLSIELQLFLFVLVTAVLSLLPLKHLLHSTSSSPVKHYWSFVGLIVLSLISWPVAAGFINPWSVGFSVFAVIAIVIEVGLLAVAGRMLMQFMRSQVWNITAVALSTLTFIFVIWHVAIFVLTASTTEIVLLLMLPLPFVAVIFPYVFGFYLQSIASRKTLRLFFFVIIGVSVLTGFLMYADIWHCHGGLTGEKHCHNFWELPHDH